MKKRNTLVIIFFLVFACTLFGQNVSGGTIYSARGDDFVILRDGKRILYDANRLNEGSVTFIPGDNFQTGPRSSADIQFGENGPLLKIVENSSIALVNNGSSQSSLLTLNLFYGRIRVKNLDGGPVIHIGSYNGLVEIKRGDAGIDYIIRSDAPVLFVTNFAGEVNVFPANDGAAVSTLPQLLVREEETVSVEFVSSLSYVERNSLESSTADFWRIYDFAPVPVSSAAIVELPDSGAEISSGDSAATETVPLPSETAVSSNVEEIPYTLLPVENPAYEVLAKRKNNALIASLVFLAGGLVLEGVALYNQKVGNVDTSYFLSLSGILVSSAGVVSLIHGLTIHLDE